MVNILVFNFAAIYEHIKEQQDALTSQVQEFVAEISLQVPSFSPQDCYIPFGQLLFLLNWVFFGYPPIHLTSLVLQNTSSLLWFCRAAGCITGPIQEILVLISLQVPSFFPLKIVTSLFGQLLFLFDCEIFVLISGFDYPTIHPLACR